MMEGDLAIVQVSHDGINWIDHVGAPRVGYRYVRQVMRRRPEPLVDVAVTASFSEPEEPPAGPNPYDHDPEGVAVIAAIARGMLGGGPSSLQERPEPPYWRAPTD
jgi:hypothetical protein